MVDKACLYGASYETGYHDERVRYRNWLSSINNDSGAWLLVGVSPKMFEAPNSEFVSAVCRRNTVEDPTTPKYTALTSREDPLTLRCSCDVSVPNLLIRVAIIW